MKKLLLTVVLATLSLISYGQTLIMNEVSQGVTGNMEYVEFVVIDTTVAYDCATGLPPSIDIRGWIFDDNSGYHGAAGIAGGCVRFSLDPFWSNIPLGTIILIYNDAQPEPTIPADDLDMSDGNCLIVAPISDPTLFESNSTTPGAIACSYPAAGWTPGGNWSNTLLANGGDCARIVDLSGCERFSVCWGTANANTQIYFAGSATNEVYWFNGVDPEDQANWSEGCTDDETVLDATQCGSNDQTPGAPNNAANAAYIASFNNGCTPIPPVAGVASVDNDEICSCDGQATAVGSGSIGPYTYEWFDATMTPIGQTTATATGLCDGDYFVTITSSIGCDITEPVTIAPASDLAITSITPTNPQCAGDCNGQITVAVTGGTPPYSYQWFDATMTPIGPDAATITGLCAGDYSVEVTDASGAAVTFFTEGFGTGCSQGNLANGTSTTNGTWSTTLTGFNGLGANDWFISATEAGMGEGNCGDGCLGTGPDDRTLHVANVATSYFACFFCPTGDCGAAYSDASIPSGFCGVEEDPTMNARAESPVIDCTGESNITLDFEYIFGGQPGVDFCTVEYFDGATWSTLTVPAQTPTCGGGQGLWTALSVPLPASADNNPSVQIGFRWEMVIDDGGTDPSFAVDNITLSSLPAACPVTASTTLTDPTPPTVTATNTSPSCANASFTVSETGGDAVSWTWTSDGGATITNNTDQTPTITNAVNGETFTVNILDAAGCPGSAQTIVTIDPVPTATISANNGPICDGQDAVFTITGTADAAVTYNINGGGSTTTTLTGGTSTITLTGVSVDQTMTLELVDDATCSDVLIEAVTIVVNPLPVVTATNGGPYCVGQSISVSETGGQATGWSWTSDGSATITNTTDNTPSITGAVTGETFTVVGTDANGCQNSAQTIITINPLPTVTAVNGGPYCEGDPMSVSETGGQATGWSWTSNGSATITNATDNTPSITGAVDGEIFTVVGTDANGCQNTAQTTITIDPLPTVTATNGGPYCVGQPMSVSETGGDATGWSWTSDGSATITNATDNTPTITGAVDGEIFTVVGTTPAGCQSSAQTTITINPLPTVSAVNGGPYCVGDPISVSETGGEATGWSWTSDGSATITNNTDQTPTITGSVDGEIFTVVGTDANGCQNTAQTAITINVPTSGTDVQTACVSYTWIDGNTYNASTNTPTWTLTNAAGCDSVVTLDLTIDVFAAGTDVQTACDSYTWIDGNTYTASNNTATYTYVGGSVNGCDSIVTLDLTMGLSNTGTDIQTACDSYTWIDGNTYTANNNTATWTLTNASGCDSVVTLDLTITNSNTGTDVQTACDSYTWIDGNTYTASNNIATWTLTNVNGCDSVVTLDLTITNSNTGTDVQAACDSYTWIDGNTYTASNNAATWTLTNAAGCDSVVTLDLTITNSNTGTDVQAACDSYTWIDGNTYTASNNTATWTLTNAAGCDSLVTLNLTITNSNSGTDIQAACDNYTWIDGNTYTASNNTATWTLTNAAGCDSVVTLDLTITNSNTGTDIQTACDSYTWIDGNTYTASNNTATWTLTNAAGCDSVVTLDLTINNANSGTDVVVACNNYTWIDGNNYTVSTNTPTWTLTNAAGCDSVVTLDLTIDIFAAGTDVQTACDSYTWIDGNTYTASNNTATYTYVGGSVNGCDSIVTLNLTISNSNTGTDVQAACDSYTWIDGNTYTASNNTATWTLTNVAGCDSVVTLDLTITNSNTGTDVQTACDSYTWIDGNTYTTSNNTATWTLTNVAGCDSVVTLDLTVNNSNTGTDVITACNNYTWIDGNNYTASTNTPTWTLTNTAGCDSVVTLNLTISNVVNGTDVQAACGSYTWIDGNTYSASNNTATFTYPGGSVNGCDSIVTLDLTINNPTQGTDVQSACGSYTWIDGNTYTASTSTPTFLYPGGATNGCDSTVTLNLTVTPFPGAPIAGTDSTYCANGEYADMTAVAGQGGVLTWYSDAGLTNVIATGGSLAPFDQEGTTVYYVTETDGSCEGPESLVTITIQGCDITIPTAFTPNADMNNDSWEIVDLDAVYPDNTVRVYNRWGSLIFEHISNNGAAPYGQNQWDGTYRGDALPVGSYYYVIEFKNADNEVATGAVSIVLD